MEILYFDSLAGISGDMTIGALLDLGVEVERLREELAKLNLDGYHLEINKGQKSGITGTDFKVQIEVSSTEHGHDHEHNHESNHTDEHNHEHEHDHEHGHEQEHSHGHHDTHEHRNLHDIQHLIGDSDLEDAVKELSLEIFQVVAKAEAKVHNKDISEVHFHEVGAVDSIVDIVGAAICINELDVDKIYASPLHTGTGFVECAHGIIPVPAPATAEILEGVPVYGKGVEGELVTPTGAAIIKTLADEFGPLPEMTIEETGYGLGDKDLGITNLLRVFKAKKKAVKI